MAHDSAATEPAGGLLKGLAALPGRWGTAAAIGGVRFYRRFLSPLKGGSCCRFTPSCSAYSLQAYQRFGFCKGTVLTIWRILRCHPFYRGPLYDPVPEKKGESTRKGQSGEAR